jgi:hypothetical protein
LAWSCFFQPFKGLDLQPTLGLDELIFDVCAQTFKLDAEIVQKKSCFQMLLEKNAMSPLQILQE